MNHQAYSSFRGMWKMVDQPIIGVLTWFHIVSVIGWSGAALTFLVAIGPSLKKLSPQANSEIALKLFPRYVRTIQVFTVLTLILGPILAFNMNALNEVGGPNAFDLISPWSRLITAGASIGIATFFLFFTPTAKGLGRLIQKMQQNPQQPPPTEFGALQTHGNPWTPSGNPLTFDRSIHGSSCPIPNLRALLGFLSVCSASVSRKTEEML